MVLIKSFFGCTDLITGGKILGWTVAVIKSILLLLVLLSFTMVQTIENVLTELLRTDKDLSEKEQEELQEAVDILKNNASPVLIVILLLVALGVATAILLIIGSHKRSRGFILPYVIYDTLSVLFWIILFFEALTEIGTDGGIQEFLVFGLFATLAIYLYLFALSLCIHVTEIPTLAPPQEAQAYLMQPNRFNPNIYQPSPFNTPYPANAATPGAYPSPYPTAGNVPYSDAAPPYSTVVGVYPAQPYPTKESV